MMVSTLDGLRKEKIMQDKLVHDEVLGDLYFPEYDNVISSQIESGGTWEMAEQNWIKSNVLPGSLVFNLGANIGYHSFIASICQRGEGKVIAVEPSKNLCRLINKNINKLNLKNVEVLNCAVTDKKGQDIIYYSESNCGDNRVSNPNAGPIEETIECKKIEDLIEEFGYPDVIIMDIQGWETFVLSNIPKSEKPIKVMFEFTPSFITQMGWDILEEINKVLKNGWTIHELSNGFEIDFKKVYDLYLIDPTPDLFFLNLVAER
jgi:FkbM family methyltransferase